MDAVDKRFRIQELRQKGLSWSEVAHKMGISVKSCQRTLRKLTKTFVFLNLPNEIQHMVLAHIPAAERLRGIGSTCHQLRTLVQKEYGAPQCTISTCAIHFGNAMIVDGLFVVEPHRRHTVNSIPGAAPDADPVDELVALPKLLRAEKLQFRWAPECLAEDRVVQKCMRRAIKLLPFSGWQNEFHHTETSNRPLPLVMEPFGPWDTSEPTWTAEAFQIDADVTNGKCRLTLEVHELRILSNNANAYAKAAITWLHRPASAVVPTASGLPQRRLQIYGYQCSDFIVGLVSKAIRVFKSDQIRRNYFFHAYQKPEYTFFFPYGRRWKMPEVDYMKTHVHVNKVTGERLLVAESPAMTRMMRFTDTPQIRSMSLYDLDKMLNAVDYKE